MGTDTEAFTPGAFWTPASAREAAGRMTGVYDSPEFQAVASQMQRDVVERAKGGTFHAEPATPAKATGAVALDACRFRRGRQADIPRMVELMMNADLPPLFIEEFIGGFCVVEHAGGVIGCGGLELYDDCGVIRSIVVDDAARGIGLGARIARLLEDDARASGTNDLYLFTAEAHPFWLHLGFIDMPLDEWRIEPRASWQYRFVAPLEDVIPVYGMWKRA
jgi:N-acetylglutamate synthase-like GNAT family acetyltransferase